MRTSPTVDPDTGAVVRTGDPLLDTAVSLENGDVYVVWQDSRFRAGRFNDVALDVSDPSAKDRCAGDWVETRVTPASFDIRQAPADSVVFPRWLPGSRRPAWSVRHRVCRLGRGGSCNDLLQRRVVRAETPAQFRLGLRGQLPHFLLLRRAEAAADRRHVPVAAAAGSPPRPHGHPTAGASRSSGAGAATVVIRISTSPVPTVGCAPADQDALRRDGPRLGEQAGDSAGRVLTGHLARLT